MSRQRVNLSPEVEVRRSRRRLSVAVKIAWMSVVTNAATNVAMIAGTIAGTSAATVAEMLVTSHAVMVHVMITTVAMPPVTRKMVAAGMTPRTERGGEKMTEGARRIGAAQQRTIVEKQRSSAERMSVDVCERHATVRKNVVARMRDAIERKRGGARKMVAAKRRLR